MAGPDSQLSNNGRGHVKSDGKQHICTFSGLHGSGDACPDLGATRGLVASGHGFGSDEIFVFGGGCHSFTCIVSRGGFCLGVPRGSFIYFLD